MKNVLLWFSKQNKINLIIKTIPIGHQKWNKLKNENKTYSLVFILFI